MTAAVTIGTERLPLKNDNAIGSLTLLKRLYISAAIKPAKIPIKTFLLLIAWKAILTFSTSTFVNIATVVGANNCIGTKKATNPAIADEPSLSFVIPRANPTANSIPRLSKIVNPAFTKKAANTLFPPEPLGSIQ